VKIAGRVVMTSNVLASCFSSDTVSLGATGNAITNLSGLNLFSIDLAATIIVASVAALSSAKITVLSLR